MNKHFKTLRLFNVPPDLTFTSTTFNPHSVLVFTIILHLLLFLL